MWLELTLILLRIKVLIWIGLLDSLMQEFEGAADIIALILTYGSVELHDDWFF